MSLIKIIEKRTAGENCGDIDDALILPYDLRQKARQRVMLRSGREAGLFLPRGTILKNGDILSTENGIQLKVLSADEEVSIAEVDDHLLLAKIAYHLGNRHVAVQVLEGRLIYLHDHVLDNMVRGLGATVTITRQPFEPEEGAYHDSGSHHH